MTIASEIQRIKDNIADAYTSCQSKGATMPATQNSDNLADCIDSISGGGGSFTGINREVVNGVYRIPTTNFTFSLPSNATNLGQYALYYAFRYCSALTSVDLSSLTILSSNDAMHYAFQQCIHLTSADLSNLTTVNSNNVMSQAFQNCSGLTNVDLSSLTTVSADSAMYMTFSGCSGLTNVDLSSLTTVDNKNVMAYTFQGCTNLTSVLFTNLERIGANNSSTNYAQLTSCFINCNKLTSIAFPNLEKIYCTGGTTTSYGTFANNNKVEKMYFPKLNTITYGTGASSTNQNACKNVFYGCSALTELHFGAANQSAIQASPGYSTAWGRGAGNVTIYFDL